MQSASRKPVPGSKPRKVGSVTLQQEFVKCGKAKCGRCRNGPVHGPYWYGYRRVGARIRSAYVGKKIDRAGVARLRKAGLYD